MNVYLIATLDTKGREADFLRTQLQRAGVPVTVVDVGVNGQPVFVPEIARDEVFTAAGASLAVLAAKQDRGAAITAAATGAAALVRRHFDQGLVSGVISIGGSAGTTIGAAAMRALPLGVPKLAVSTLASGQVRHYVGDKDIVMFNSIVDIVGVNRITRAVLTNAARAMAGMVTLIPESGRADATSDRPMIAATMFGVTTPAVEHARAVLEQAGYEVLVFHATGSGGQAMESIIREGLIAGVLDLTTTELADELVGGFLSAGPDRLTAAARAGIPQVVSVGATDMVNFHAVDTVPDRFQGRKLYQHNASVTLMRTTTAENRLIGADMGRKVAQSRGPAAILLPLRGVSAIDRANAPFDDPSARQALFAAIREHAGQVEVIELDSHINDVSFAEAAARKLIELINDTTVRPSTSQDTCS